MSSTLTSPKALEDDQSCRCQSCSAVWAESQLKPIEDVLDRVMPGEIMPPGECPSCGALAQYADDAEPQISGRPDVTAVLVRTDWTMLAKQKGALVGVLAAVKEDQDLDGLLNWIDAIQDAAAAEGYPVVFLTEPA